jgi:MarR family transcriptional regulator, organic hydroperoxide resistance regulator
MSSALDIDRVLALDEQICFALYTASRLITRGYRPWLEPLGLTYPQYLVMLVLWEEAPDGALSVSVSRLGERLHLDSGTLTPLLKRMEQSGLVRRERSSSDERFVDVRLTPEGVELKERARAIPLGLLCQSRLAPIELIEIRDAVKRLVSDLESRD